tara:strand:+ start:296874 stop:297248 length:375 start_codon:yes stop_codon:yes gene_type:complete
MTMPALPAQADFLTGGSCEFVVAGNITRNMWGRYTITPIDSWVIDKNGKRGGGLASFLMQNTQKKSKYTAISQNLWRQLYCIIVMPLEICEKKVPLIMRGGRLSSLNGNRMIFETKHYMFGFFY